MYINGVPCSPSKFTNEILFRLAKISFTKPAKGSTAKELNNGAKRAMAIKRLQECDGDTSRLSPREVMPETAFNGREVIRQKSGKVMRTYRKRGQLLDRQRRATEGKAAVRREDKNHSRAIAGMEPV